MRQMLPSRLFSGSIARVTRYDQQHPDSVDMLQVMIRTARNNQENLLFG